MRRRTSPPSATYLVRNVVLTWEVALVSAIRSDCPNPTGSNISAVTAYEKVSLTLDADLLAQLRARVPRGQVSSFVNEAVRHQLELDDLADVADELVTTHGHPDPAEVERFRQLLQS